MRPLLATALLLASLPARGWFWEGADPTPKTKSLYAAGKYNEVVAALSPESLQKLNRDRLQQAYFYLGLSYERMGRLTEALSTYQIATKLFPKNINLLSELGGILHQVGLNEQAQPIFEKVLSIHPNNERAHLGLAEIERQLGLLDESSDHYERTLEINAEQAPVWRDYAEVLLAMRDTKTAELAIQKSLSLSADNEATIDLAFIERAQGRLDDAIDTLELARKAQPGRDDIALTMGLWLLEAGRPHQARDLAAARLKADPSDPLALWISARESLSEGRMADAVRSLRGAAGAARRAPFIAKAAAALLVELQGTSGGL